MSDLGSTNYSETDASNNASPPNGWPEGMNPSDVNNSARANMGADKRWWNRSNAVKTTAGSTTNFTLTYDVAAASYYNGELHAFVADRDCVATATLNINGLGAKNVRKFTAAAWANVANGDWLANQIVIVRYNQSADKFDIVNVSASWTDFLSASANNAFTGNNTHSGTETFSGTVTMNGKAINMAQGADIASATTTDIGAATGNYVKITGTTTITGLGTVQAGTARFVEFTGALTLTHNATSLILEGGQNILTAAGDCAIFVSEGSGNWRCLGYRYASANAGQLVSTISTGVATGTTQLPCDDTIPQNTEGDQYMSLAITPRNAASKLEISVVWCGATNYAGVATITAALFQDSTANALACAPMISNAVNGMVAIAFKYTMTAGTTSSTTFKVRAGVNGANTTTFNGNVGSRFYGGVMTSSITIREVLP